MATSFFQNAHNFSVGNITNSGIKGDCVDLGSRKVRNVYRGSANYYDTHDHSYHDNSSHHHGNAYNDTTHNNGTVNHIGHIRSANMGDNYGTMTMNNRPGVGPSDYQRADGPYPCHPGPTNSGRYDRRPNPAPAQFFQEAEQCNEGVSFNTTERQTPRSHLATPPAPFPARSDDSREFRSQKQERADQSQTAQRTGKLRRSDSYSRQCDSDLSETLSDGHDEGAPNSDTESASSIEDEDKTDRMLREYEERQSLKQSAESKKAKEVAKNTEVRRENAHLTSTLLHDKNNKPYHVEQSSHLSSTSRPLQQMTQTSSGIKTTMDSGRKLEAHGAQSDSVSKTAEQVTKSKKSGIGRRMANMFRSSKKAGRD